VGGLIRDRMAGGIQGHQLLTCRHPLLQFFKPIQHHVDLRRGGFLLIGLEHQEALAVRGDTAVWEKGGCPLLSLTGEPRNACTAARLGYYSAGSCIQYFPTSKNSSHSMNGKYSSKGCS